MRFPGSHLQDVGFAAQFVVWAARQWIRLSSADQPEARRLGEAFARVGAPRALLALDAVLGTLARRARRRLDFRSCGEAYLGLDEQRLIEVIDALQSQPSDRWHCACAASARGIVTGWVGPRDVEPLQCSLAELAAELGAAGLLVSCPARQARAVAPAVHRLH